MMTSKIHFYGGTGSVTGSNFLLETLPSKEGSVPLRALVDCGLTQGQHNAGEVNWQPFAYDPSSISFLIVTHAHVDHIGRIPKLVKDGFKGRIISTEATKALSEPLLMDSMELLANDARRHGKEILYTEHDIERAMKLWEGIGYHEPMELADGVTLEFFNSGHILGSAMARFSRGGKTIIFTGDLGGGNSPLLPLVEDIPGTNYLVMESVYADRVRADDSNRRDQLEDIIEDTAKRGGTLLIPAFSTERTQDLLYEIRGLIVEGRVPQMPVYIDSPLAEKITAAFTRYPKYFSEAVQKEIEAGEKVFSFPGMHFVADNEESKRVASLPGPKIVLAGSGMSNGGRVHIHEQVVLRDKNSTLLIVGYQAAGSLGRRLLEGEKSVLLDREKVTVVSSVKAIYGYSAHMDGEQLLEFVNKIAPTLTKVFVVMGEPASSGFLVQRIRDYLGTNAVAPTLGDEIEIDL